jgi:signal transduction histidine kinase/CheY-like chemotaxis protein
MDGLVTRPLRPTLPRWAVSVLAVLAASGLGWMLTPWVGAESAYLLFTVAVMVSARYGGLWSGLAATLLGGSIVLGVFASSPGSPAQWLLLAVFLAVGTCLSYLTERLAGSATLTLDRADDLRRLESELAEARGREDALRQSEERLHEAGRLKDDFLATVAHELRTPLGAMLGWAHVLREEKVDEATSARALDAILRNARVQTRLISDLLDISRVVAGTMRVEMQTVELVAVIRAALETVRPAADSKGVTLTSNVDAEAGPVTGDPSRLQQVLWNLLTNSIKFTPGGGTVAVRVQAVGGHVEVTVEDTGPGIPPDFLPHVFERFRQAGGGATRGKGGLGLGMAITRHLVELHDGSITVANRESPSGAVFTVRLPIKALRPGEARPSPAPAPAQEPEANGRIPSLDGLRVLVVDDGDETREMVAAILEKRGVRVTALPSANEALAALAEERPDVLLLDLELADAGGESLIQKIRALPAAEGGATPAAALAAFATIDRTRALLAGFQLQLAKPVRPAELVAAVASLAGRTRQPAEAQEARA